MTLEKVVQATVNSLGFVDDGVYSPEPDCYASLHDLVRYLHNDRETLDARRICLVHNIVRNDLVPIMVAPNTEEDLFNLSLRLTVNLCQPTILAFGGKMPETEDVIEVYHDCEKNLINTLSGFTQPKIFEKFAVILENFFSKDWTDRNESNKTVVDRIIMLLRYIFAIGMECPLTAEMATVDPLVKERVLRAFLDTKLPTILMAVGCDRMEKELSVHIMAIFSLLLRSVDCEHVATAHQTTTSDQKQQEEQELKEMLERDRLILTARRSQLTTNRSHLGATYVMKNAALNPEKDLLVQKNSASTPLNNLRSRKRNYRGTKRSRVRNVMETVFKPNKHTPLDICQLMNTFCKEFILRAFDKLMKATREIAFVNVKAGGVLAYSDVNYFFLAEYIFQFIRISQMSIEKIGSVFSRDFLHSIVSQCENYFDLMKIEKFNVTLLSVRAQHAISAYKEMMLLLNILSKSERDEDKQAFSYVTQTIYYNEEYREFCYTTLNRLQPQGMTRKLLDDLIVASHYYILTMDYIIKTGELQVVAKRKRIAKQRKKKAKQLIEETKDNAKVDKMDDAELDQLWNEFSTEIRDVLDGKIEANDEISPINILLKVNDEEHQIFAAVQVQRALRGRRICDAVGLFKAARDLWPDSTFGEYSNTAEQDISILQDIYKMKLVDIANDYDEKMKAAYGVKASDATKDEEEHVSVSDNEQKKQAEAVNDSEDSEDEERPKYKIAEINFDFNDYIQQFTKPDIIHWYVFALKSFETNSVELNRAVLKMFHRISFQLNNPSRLYLAMLFRVFMRVNVEIQKWPKEVAKKHQLYDIYKFGYHLLQKFFDHYKERGELLICELLFSKNNKECAEIENGYGSYNFDFSENQINTTSLWTEALEEELQSLYNEYQALEEKPEGISVVDFIQHNLSKERYPKQIQRQLKRLGLPVEKIKKPRKPRKEGGKGGRKSKKTADDQVFTSQSPTRSDAPSSHATDDETDSGTDDKFVESDRSDGSANKVSFTGVEGRLLQEESVFLAESQRSSQSIVAKEKRKSTVFEEQSQPSEVLPLSGAGDMLSQSSPKPSKKPRKARKVVEKRQKPSPPETDADENNENAPYENPTPIKERSGQPMRRVVASDDSDNDSLTGVFDDSQDVNKSTAVNASKRFIDSDDDEPVGEELAAVTQHKRPKIVDDDDES